MLVALLAKPEAVVSKLELASILWPGEQYGDFDRAIHNLISKLRRMHPQGAAWIETIPKTGYRFSIPVEVELAAADPVQQEPEGDTPLEAPPIPPAERLATVTEPASSARQRSKWPVLAVAAGALALLCLVAVALWQQHARSEQVSLQPVVVGVLPFTGTHIDAGQSDTLRESLADALAALPNVEVRASHSLTAETTSDAARLQTVAHDLRLNVLVAGNLETGATGYTLNLELIRGDDGTHLSSLHYQGVTASLGALPDRIAAGLAPLLLKKSDTESQHLLGGTTSQQAYSLAFQASTAMAQRTREQMDQAVSLYKQALALDPKFARAWSGLAESNLVLANFGREEGMEKSFEESRKAALQALALDPGNAEAHSTLGLILLQHDWKLGEAEKQMRLAIASNPGLAANYLHLAVLLADEGRFAEASTAIDHATEVDPEWPVIHGTSMYVHIMAREYDRAISDAQALVHFRPDWSRAHRHLGWAFWYAGKHAAAVEEWQHAALLEKNEREAQMEEHGKEELMTRGVRAYAEFKLASNLAKPIDDDFVDAEWYAFAGDQEHTLAALEKMVTARNPESLKIPWNPAYDFIRSNGRFTHLMQEVQHASNAN